MSAQRNGASIDDMLQRVLADAVPKYDLARLQSTFDTSVKSLAYDHRIAKPIPRRRVMYLVRAVSLCTAIGAIVAVFSNGSATAPAWAEIATAVHAKRWIHCRSSHDANDRPQMEFWFIPRDEITAMRVGTSMELQFASFSDGRAGESRSYRAGEGIIRVRPYRRAEGEMGQFGALLAAFGKKDQTIKLDANEGVRLKKQEQRVVEEDGSQWIVYALTFEEQHGVKEQYVAEFRVDPETHLPRYWSRRSLDGSKKVEFEIDFPEAGPANIHDLDVPQDAKKKGQE